MSRQDAFDRSIAQWLDAEARSGATADVLDGALRATRRRRPHPRLLAAMGSHWVGDSASPTSAVAKLSRTGLRASTALTLLLLLLALVAGVVLVGAQLVRPSSATALAYGVDGDVFLADADGSNAVRIADGDPGAAACTLGEGRAHYTVNGTAWSPDGRHLAYWDWRGPRCRPNGWGRVIISDAQGKHVASFPGEGWAISWSPDSTRVAVLDAWAPGAGQGVTIGIYMLDGTRQATLTVPAALAPDSGDYSPWWSRDGSSILLPGVRVPLDGATPTPATDGFYSGCCAYSPDGSRQAIVDNGTLVVEDADLPDAQKSGPTEFWKLAWSPNGQLIAFEAAPDPRDGFATRLLVRDVATGAERSILDVAPGRLHVIEFSADGDRIYFTRADAGGSTSSLWSIGPDGSDPRRLVDRIQWADLRPETATASPSPTRSAASTSSPGASAGEPALPALSETFTSGIHGMTVSHPSSWHPRPATEPWDGELVGQDSAFADVIYEKETDSPFIALASQPLAGKSFDGWANAYLAKLIADDASCDHATERITVDGAPGVLADACFVALASDGLRGYLIWLYRVEDRAWFDEILASVRLRPGDAVDATP